MSAAALNQFRLDGRVVLVTGASSGLGTHFAQLLASVGARVAVAARRADKLQAVVDGITAAGGQARPLLEQTEEDFDQVLDTNLKGCWLVATEAARRMVAAGQGGSIVNVASILGERVAGGVAPYAISKAGVVQATKAMALELARHRIRVNALLPGYVVTDLNRDFLTSEAGDKLRSRIPSRRFGEMTDLDGPLLLLASDAGAAMSGATVAVDGAHLVSSL
ncbi:MAG: SDR family oxidoreductase [Alicycliphilus sp.]|nr:SDR family oxidoreductase [Alicycliphilus sp.]